MDMTLIIFCRNFSSIVEGPQWLLMTTLTAFIFNNQLPKEQFLCILFRRKNLYYYFCCCCCFIVSCQVFSFLSSLVSFVSYQFYTCYIYLDIIYILFVCYLFGQLSSLQNILEHIVLQVSFFHLFVWSHFRVRFCLASVLVYFALSFSSTFTHTL